MFVDASINTCPSSKFSRIPAGEMKKAAPVTATSFTSTVGR